MRNYVLGALGALMVCAISVYASSAYIYKIQVTPETVAVYKKNMGPFLEKRKKQTGLLNTGLGGFFASLSGVNVQEARLFLARAFENQQLLDKAIDGLDEDPVAIAYMQEVIDELTPSAIHRKNTKRLPVIMRDHKFPAFKDKDEPWNKEDVSDKEFYNGAACSFMIYHLVESDGPARVKIHEKK